jgi:hypothetical protein
MHFDCREVYHLFAIAAAASELQRFSGALVVADAARTNVTVPYETSDGSLFGSGLAAKCDASLVAANRHSSRPQGKKS